MTSLLAPRLEVYTILICREMRPDIYYEKSSTGPALLSPSASTPTRSQLCASDPVIQAGVSKLAARTSCHLSLHTVIMPLTTPSSDDHIHGYPQLPVHGLVGCCESASCCLVAVVNLELVLGPLRPLPCDGNFSHRLVVDGSQLYFYRFPHGCISESLLASPTRSYCGRLPWG
jgi:hypothetical protein